MRPDGYFHRFDGIALVPDRAPDWYATAVDNKDWEVALRRGGYCEYPVHALGDVQGSILSADVYRRDDLERGSRWLFDFSAASRCCAVEVLGFAAYVAFLRWLAPALTVGTLEDFAERQGCLLSKIDDLLERLP